MEPLMKVDITTPEEYMGDVLGDINSRRGLMRRGACTHSMATEIEGFKPYRPTSNLAHAVHSPFFRQRARAPIHQNLRACTVHTPPPPTNPPFPRHTKFKFLKTAPTKLCAKKSHPLKTLTTRFFSNRSHQ